MIQKKKKVVFNIIKSEINHVDRCDTYWKIHPDVPQRKGGGLIHQGKKAGSYFHYVCWAAKPAIDWCHAQGLDIKIRGGPYAMQLTFVFRNDSEAAHFILRWL